MMRAIVGLTVTYLMLVGILMIWAADGDSVVSNVIFGELVFSSPMILGCMLALAMKQRTSLEVMLAFASAYPVVSALMYLRIEMGEHDALWQLAFLFIPMVGIVGVLIFSAIAVSWRNPQNPAN